MTLKHSLSFIFCLAFTTIAAWTQSNKFSNSIFRFATRAEGQMLITELVIWSSGILPILIKKR